MGVTIQPERFYTYIYNRQLIFHYDLYLCTKKIEYPLTKHGDTLKCYFANNLIQMFVLKAKLSFDEWNYYVTVIIIYF